MPSGRDLACVGAPPIGGSLGTWAEVKRILLQVTTDVKTGLVELSRHQATALDVIYDPEVESHCTLGHYALRLAFYYFIASADRAGRLCGEPLPFSLGASVLEILASGWPVFGILGLLAYRLVRDGTAKGLGVGAGVDCSEELESFRVRYEAAAFENQEARFSRDVESIVEALLPGGAAATHTEGVNETQRCCLGAALPLLGHASSIQCLARRDPPLLSRVESLVGAAVDGYLRPAASRPSWITGEMVGACRMQETAVRGSLLALFAAGLWAAEALMLLQHVAPAFAAEGPRPPLGGPEPFAGADAVVSFDPHEDRFYGRGLPGIVDHVFGGEGVPGFRVRHALPCADVLVVRDSLPALPFVGALVYVDHEAGLGPGRDAGRLDVVLDRHRTVYLGVLEPFAETRCASRFGSAAAQSRRVCAKVYSGNAPWPPERKRRPKASEPRAVGAVRAGEAARAIAEVREPHLAVVHVPLASTSFANRRMHSPLDLALGPRPFTAKPKLLAYMAYTCVDHRERLFDLLVAAAARRGLGAVDALSRCAGYRSRHRRVGRNHTRGNEADFLDEAVRLYEPYRFALVFENKLVPGYVTEKIVNAFLAGSIPIYWGSESVRDIFNPGAFIYANELQGNGGDRAGADPLQGLERVAEAVAKVAEDEQALRRFATAPVVSKAQLQRYFSWHRDVRRRLQDEGGPAEDVVKEDLPQRLAAALAVALEPRRRLQRCSDGSGRVCPVSY